MSRCSEISYTAVGKLVGTMSSLQRLSILKCKKISKYNEQALHRLQPGKYLFFIWLYIKIINLYNNNLIN